MWIKKFNKFKESVIIRSFDFELNDSINIWYDSLLSSIDAEEVNIEDTLKLNINNTDLEYLNDNNNFIKSLSSLGLKKSNMELSSDYETFLNKPCRFMFIYDINASELETPKYLLLQISNENGYDNTKCYKINNNINNFYDQLSSKRIEIIDNDKRFIYETSDKNTWELKSEHEDEFFKRSMRKEDLEKTINERKAKVKVI